MGIDCLHLLAHLHIHIDDPEITDADIAEAGIDTAIYVLTLSGNELCDLRKLRASLKN